MVQIRSKIFTSGYVIPMIYVRTAYPVLGLTCNKDSRWDAANDIAIPKDVTVMSDDNGGMQLACVNEEMAAWIHNGYDI